MKTYILIHLMPHEIDWFEWQAKQLKIGSYSVDSDDLVVDVTLNLNLIDWDKSELPKQYFIDRFNQIISSYFDWCQTLIDINEDGTCNGCADKRRTSLRTLADAANFIYLDCDVIFNTGTLEVLLNAAKLVTNKHYIISPQITKLWDTSWDVLVNKHHIDDLWDNKTFNDPYKVISTDYGPLELAENITFKIGGGWFNLISAELLRLADLPDSIGAYGPDDTYLMYCCIMLKQAGVDIKQYIVQNLLVAENHKYRTNIYVPYLQSIRDRTTFRQEGEVAIEQEIQKFFNKLQSNTR